LRQEMSLLPHPPQVVVVNPGAMKTPLLKDSIKYGFTPRKGSRWSEQMQRGGAVAVEYMKKHGQDPIEVAKVVLEIVHDKSPKRRYLVNISWEMRLAGFLPQRVLDYATWKMMQKSVGGGNGGGVWKGLLGVLLGAVGYWWYSANGVNGGLKSCNTGSGLFAGLVAGVVSSAVLYPLENIETRQQTMPPSSTASSFLDVGRVVHAKEGLAGFYRGATPAIVGGGLNWMIYSSLFLWFATSVPAQMYGHHNNGERTMLTDLIAGCCTGIMTCWCVNPFWVLKVRLSSLADASDSSDSSDSSHSSHSSNLPVHARIAAIVHDEGVWVLWSGIVPSMCGCFEGALQFVMVEYIKRTSSVVTSPPALSFLLVGAVARSLAVVVCYPYQSIRSIQQRSPTGFVWSHHAGQLYSGVSTKVVREFVWGGIYTFLREQLLTWDVSPLHWVSLVVGMVGVVCGWLFSVSPSSVPPALPLYVPEDCKTLQEAVARVDHDSRLTTIVLGKG
jgi:hypothetical protein